MFAIDYTDARWIQYRRDLRLIQQEHGSRITPDLSVRIGRVGDRAEACVRKDGNMDILRQAIIVIRTVIQQNS